jgi:hypothetical protein
LDCPHPSDGTIGGVVGKLLVLRVECPTCGRQGRYHVARLLAEFGPPYVRAVFGKELIALRRLVAANKILVDQGVAFSATPCWFERKRAPWDSDGPRGELQDMLRILVSAATAAFFATQLLGAAHASTVTYNLALTETLGPESGTGTLTINGPIAGGVNTYTSASGGGLTSLSFSIDGSTFGLGNALGTSSATFSNGNLVALYYVGALDGFKLSLDTLGLGYGYTDLLNLSHDSIGTISAIATPLPPTWTILLIGLAGLGFFLYRKKRPDISTGAVTA